MNTPGISLFQGAESLKMNSSLERREEEEALEDQRRRDEELGNLLQNAFDDLEDDETTIDSTSNFQSDLLEQKNNNNEQLCNYVQQEQHNGQVVPTMVQQQTYDSEIHKLKMLLESRTNELENVKQMANDEFKKRDEYQKRLTIAEAELDRVLSSKKNSHELLVESKEKCSNLESTIAKMQSDRKALETEYNTLLGKLETSQMLLSDIQRKYDMVERDLGLHNDRNAELRRKQMDDRHRAQMDMMQQQLEQLANKLDKKTSEFDSLSARYTALQNSHELMLVDKASKINDLNNALNETQKRCDELLTKPDYYQENVRLQKFITSLQDQIQSMEKTIATLRERLDFTTAELNTMDSVLHQYNLDDSPRRLSQVYSNKKFVGSTPLNTMDRLGNLKDELFRALKNVKGKREEIRKLQQNLDEKSTEIRTLKDEENKALVQITTLKEENIRLENRMKMLEEECEELRSETTEKSLNNSKIQSLSDELRKLKEENANLKEQRDVLEHDRNSQELERKKLHAQVNNVEVDLEELKQEHESMKLNYEQILKENQNLRSRTTADSLRLELEKHRLLLKDAQAECDRLKNLYVEISNAKESLAYEMDKIQNSDSVKELQEQREKVANLQRALQLAEIKSSELVKILETEKLCHERDMRELKEKFKRESTRGLNTDKEGSNNCSKCIDYIAEITKLEIQNLKLANTNSVNKKEIDELSQALSKSKALVTELADKLKLSEQQEQLIKELRGKAQQFEDYIKVQSSASEKSILSSKGSESSQNCANTKTEKEKFEIKKIEKRIRDEMAKIFANELKCLQVQLHQSEEKQQCVQREYQHVCEGLEQRQAEVELLKQAILAEREKMGEILKHKSEEYQCLVQKQNVMLHKCRDELRAKNDKIVEVRRELEERQEQIEAERKSMKAVMQQWEKHRGSVDELESEWKLKWEAMEQSHKSAIDSWQKKLDHAKRMEKNLKLYIKDKDAHIKKEFALLQTQYDAKLAKFQVTLQEMIAKKDQEKKDAIAKVLKQRSSNKENKPCN